MTEIDDQYDQPRVLDSADDPPVANAVTPEPRQFAGQSLAAHMRVASRGDGFQIGDDAGGGLAIERPQGTPRTRAELNLPDQARVSFR